MLERTFTFFCNPGKPEDAQPPVPWRHTVGARLSNFQKIYRTYTYLLSPGPACLRGQCRTKARRRHNKRSPHDGSCGSPYGSAVLLASLEQKRAHGVRRAPGRALNQPGMRVIIVAVAPQHAHHLCRGWRIAGAMVGSGGGPIVGTGTCPSVLVGNLRGLCYPGSRSERWLLVLDLVLDPHEPRGETGGVATRYRELHRDGCAENRLDLHISPHGMGVES